MACFTVPAAEAIITTIAGKIIKSKENHQTIDASKNTDEAPKIAFSTKIGWLNKMLWGGSALLAFEHIWHGEVVPFFPFLTAVQNGEAAEMLHEMATAGVSMALIVTAVWGIMVGVVSIFEKHTDKTSATGTLAGGLA